MDLRILRYFVAVVEAGSLRAAAAQLHLSQPTLSVAMTRLESDLGADLLVRSARGVEPTAAGRYLVEAATRLLGDADDARRTLARFGEGSLGTLTLAAVPALIWQRIPRLLRDLAADVPDVEVRLAEVPPWTALDMLRDRTADAAAILVAEPRRFTERHRDELRVTDAGAVPLVVALPPDETAAPDRLRLEDLAGRVHLLPRRTAALTSLPEAVDRYFADHGIVPRHARTVETIQTALTLVSAGQGVAIVPDPDGTSLRRFDVVTRPLDPEPPPLQALVAVRAERLDGALARLLDHVRRGATSMSPAPDDVAG